MKKLIKYTITVLLFAVLPFFNNYASNFNFRYYQVEDGLSSNTVYSLIQDSRGFIWIGTEDGLNRFDGYEFRIFRNVSRDESSVLSNHIYTLFEDETGNIWAGTEKGISIYDYQAGKFKTLDIKTKKGVQVKGNIRSIVGDKDGNIWICVYEQGVFRLSRDKNTLDFYGFDNSKVTCLYKDKDGDLWVSATKNPDRILRFDKSGNRFVPGLPDTDPGLLSNMSFYSMTEDSFGTLWIGSWDKGLFAIDKKTLTVTRFLQDVVNEKILHIHTIMEYEPGLLLIGSDEGLTFYSINKASGLDNSKLQLKEKSLSNKFVYPVYKDREGGLWVGTYYGGINYSSPNRNNFRSYIHDPDKNSISGKVLSNMCEDSKGNIWIGTDDAGLNYYNTSTGQFTKYKTGGDNLSFHNIHGLCQDGDYLWIGTYTGGLNLLNTKTNKVKVFRSVSSDVTTIDGNSIYSIYKDSNSDIWVGTMWGMNRYDKKTEKFVREKNTNLTTFDILQVDNYLFFATQGGGLYRYDLKTKKWNNYSYSSNDRNSLISNDVSCLATDNNGLLWIGTNNGICTYNLKTGGFSEVDVDFPSNNISNMIFHNNMLWVTTTKGLVLYNPRNKSYRVFTKDDGLLSEQFTTKSGLLTKSGTIYVGTAQGLNSFNPSQLVNNPYIPQIEISDFLINNKSVSLSEYFKTDKKGKTTITLPYSKNGFSIEFASLSFFAPGKNQYTCMLEGFEDDWNYTGNQRSATYTNLSPGKYVFKVKGSNNDGVWNNSGLSVNIIITPPFWLNIWFKILYFLIILAGSYYFLKYLKKRQEEKQKEEIERIKSEQEKEVYNAKINFFTSIAHEIRTPVSLIIGPLEKITELSSTLPEKIRGDLNIIERNAQRLLFLVNQLLDFRKIERETITTNITGVNINELLMNIYDEFKPYMEYRNIRFEYKTDNKDFVNKTDAENLRKVISNLLNNTSKYSKDHVVLELITVGITDNYEIKVTDNGPGISIDEYDNIFKPFYQIPGVNKPGTGIGLYLVKSIVDSLGGTIIVDKNPEGGSVFTVKLPDNIKDNSAEVYSVENVDIIESEDDVKKQKPVLLILEDNVDMQEFLWKNFSEDYSILTGYDGREGIEILEKNEVDLIISDIMMPNMDGIEFCKKVKSSFLWNHLPLILLTAKTNIATKIEAMETGADAYVEKPFSINFLTAQVKNLLETRKALQSKFAETPFMTLKSMAGNKADEEFLLKVNEIIEKNISNMDFSVEHLSEELCVSSSGLYAKIKTLSGITPNKLLLLVRLKKAAELLCLNDYRVSEVCYMVGFNNPSYFAKCFYKQFGVLPKDFKCGQ